jgi:hypothetical protein
VSQLTRRYSDTAFLDRCNDIQTAVSSNPRVCFDPCRAHGTCCTVAPCSLHQTLGESDSRYTLQLFPMSIARQRRLPFPLSYPLHFFPQIPHRHESRLAGRTRMMIVGFVSGFSISTFSTTIRLTPAIYFAKLEIVTGLFS